MIKRNQTILNRLNALLDWVLIIASYVFSAWLYLIALDHDQGNMAALSARSVGVAAAAALGLLLLFTLSGFYSATRTRRLTWKLGVIVVSVTGVALAWSFMLYLLRLENFSRGVLFLFYGCTVAALCAKYSFMAWVFRAMRTAGGQVVHLTISSELSASYNTARLAAEELDGVYVVDSRQLSTGVGLLAIEGAECRDRGMDAAAIAEHLRGLTDKVETSFVLDTLEFMRKGGRCSNFAALGANLLKLKPALEMRGGKLNVYKKYRGNIDRVYREYIAERLAGKRIRPGHVFLTDSGGVDAALLRELEALVRALIPVREVHHTYAGCTVSTHCGPKTLGVLFLDE